MAPKKILQWPVVRKRNTKKLEINFDQLAGQFAELSMFVKMQMDKPGSEATVDEDFSCSYCG